MARKAASKKKAATKKTTAAKPAGKKVVRKKTPAVKKQIATRRPARQNETPSLGRPKVTAEEKLYLLFKDDYHARQLFEFLRAETVRDLEQLSPHDIISRLSQPLRETVDRIRKKLAEKNRCLRGDEEYAARHPSD